MRTCEFIEDNIALVQGYNTGDSLSDIFRRTSVRLHLIEILKYIKEHPTPRLEYGNEEYWSIPRPYLMGQYGGTAETWQGHIVFLIDAGLLRRLIPNSQSTHPRLREAYTNAVSEGGRPESFYSVPQYTQELMDHANVVVNEYNEHGMRIGHITKTDMVRLRGQEWANLLYMDRRRIKPEEQYVCRCMVRIILRNLETRGYLTRKILYGTAKSELGIRNLSDGSMDTSNPYTRYYRKYLDRPGQLVARANAVYRQPTSEDRERFGLTSGEWIIVPREEQ